MNIRNFANTGLHTAKLLILYLLSIHLHLYTCLICYILCIYIFVYIYIYIYILYTYISIYPNQNAQTKHTKRRKQIKQLLENLLLVIKMYTDFSTGVIWMNAMCAVPLACHLKAVADAFRPLRTHQRYGAAKR